MNIGDGEIDKKEIAKGFMLHQLSSVHLINQTFDAADLDNNGCNSVRLHKIPIVSSSAPTFFRIFRRERV